VVEGGKVKAVGTKVKPPPLARVIRARGQTVMAGLVCPATGLGTSVRSVRRPGTEVRLRRLDDVDPWDAVWEAARRHGVTTLVLAPDALGVGGRAAVVKPVRGSREDMSVGSEEPLLLGFRADTATKAAFRKGLDAARKWIAARAAYDREMEARKKAAEEAKKAAGEAGKKAEDGKKPAVPATPAKPEPKAPAEDPRVMPFVRALRGEVPSLLRLVGDEGDHAHLAPILRETGLKPVLVLDGIVALRLAEELKAAKRTVVVPARLETDSRTGQWRNAPHELLRAGVEFALAPSGTSARAFAEYRHRLALLVKFGLPRQAALASVTTVPARMLGLEKRLGTVTPGADADLVFLDGDPLDPLARVVRVLVGGEVVHEATEVSR
jgi:imidazolonepropionase-like amidohydrolase